MGRKQIVALIILAFLISGCGTVLHPFAGALYSSNTKSPIMATSNVGDSKTGTATATSVIGISHGDASIKKAAANGGITKIKTVDVKIRQFLGLFVEYTTIVTGE